MSDAANNSMRGAPSSSHSSSERRQVPSDQPDRCFDEVPHTSSESSHAGTPKQGTDSLRQSQVIKKSPCVSESSAAKIAPAPFPPAPSSPKTTTQGLLKTGSTTSSVVGGNTPVPNTTRDNFSEVMRRKRGQTLSGIASRQLVLGLPQKQSSLPRLPAPLETVDDLLSQTRRAANSSMVGTPQSGTGVRTPQPQSQPQFLSSSQIAMRLPLDAPSPPSFNKPEDTHQSSVGSSVSNSQLSANKLDVPFLSTFAALSIHHIPCWLIVYVALVVFAVLTQINLNSTSAIVVKSINVAAATSKREALSTALYVTRQMQEYKLELVELFAAVRRNDHSKVISLRPKYSALSVDERRSHLAQEKRQYEALEKIRHSMISSIARELLWCDDASKGELGDTLDEELDASNLHSCDIVERRLEVALDDMSRKDSEISSDATHRVVQKYRKQLMKMLHPHRSVAHHQQNPNHPADQGASSSEVNSEESSTAQEIQPNNITESSHVVDHSSAGDNGGAETPIQEPEPGFDDDDDVVIKRIARLRNIATVEDSTVVLFVIGRIREWYSISWVREVSGMVLVTILVILMLRSR